MAGDSGTPCIYPYSGAAARLPTTKHRHEYRTGGARASKQTQRQLQRSPPRAAATRSATKTHRQNKENEGQGRKGENSRNNNQKQYEWGRFGNLRRAKAKLPTDASREIYK